MNQSAGALALAGRDQGVSFGLLVAEADLAVVLPCLNGLVVGILILGDLKDSIGFIEVVGISEGEGFSLILGLDHHIFHPA